MKTLLKMALGAAFVALTLVGCSNGGNSGSGTATTAVNYTLSNGVCYNGQTQVDSYLCTSISNYYQVNGYCYATTGERIDNSYCNSQSYLRLQPRQCEGQFFMPRAGKMRAMTCRDRNCRDNLMFDQHGRPVHCR
ncbi:MAG: hypothetical protein J7501_02925 [Bdellovibrio sp.]|nr:hypothetical protein [Bdellovibrio sp.]